MCVSAIRFAVNDWRLPNELASMISFYRVIVLYSMIDHSGEIFATYLPINRRNRGFSEIAERSVPIYRIKSYLVGVFDKKLITLNALSSELFPVFSNFSFGGVTVVS